jgi:hemerythrin superfamily protein
LAKQDAIALLKADHAAVKKLFLQESKASKQASKASKRNGHETHDGEEELYIFNEIMTALTVHATIEEEIFYPAVKRARAGHVKDEVREAYGEHKQIKSLLAQIAEVPLSDEAYHKMIKVLKENVEHHVKEEEGQMFPDAKKFLGEKRLVELGAQLEARKKEIENNSASKERSHSESVADE